MTNLTNKWQVGICSLFQQDDASSDKRVTRENATCIHILCYWKMWNFNTFLNLSLTDLMIVSVDYSPKKLFSPIMSKAEFLTGIKKQRAKTYFSRILSKNDENRSKFLLCVKEFTGVLFASCFHHLGLIGIKPCLKGVFLKLHCGIFMVILF